MGGRGSPTTGAVARLGRTLIREVTSGPPFEVWRRSWCAATLAGMTREADGTLHDSEPSLGGDTIDEAVENSEEGTQAEDTGHTPSGNEPSGDSRGEQMKDVVEHEEN